VIMGGPIRVIGDKRGAAVGGRHAAPDPWIRDLWLSGRPARWAATHASKRLLSDAYLFVKAGIRLAERCRSATHRRLTNLECAALQWEAHDVN
jgi:hypothetical protein